MPGSTDPTRADVVYHRAGGQDLHADVFASRGDRRRSVVLQFHGGGWRGGSRAGVHSRCWELAGHGFTTVAVEYRLLPEARILDLSFGRASQEITVASIRRFGEKVLPEIRDLGTSAA
jgi:acetyl esterase/lipase